MLTAWADPPDAPLVVSSGDRLAVGIARLDNRSELERVIGLDAAGFTDLQVLLQAVVRCGAGCLPRILGDFGFVTWDPATHTVIAACDALSIKKLYYARRDGLLAFSNRAEPLAAGDRYDLQFLAERVAACEAAQDLTVYDGVRALPGGTYATLTDAKLAIHRYWSPDECEPIPERSIDAAEAVATMRGLLLEAVRCRLSDTTGVWCQLSGGIDSSSVVSVAQWLFANGRAKHGLSGTVSYVDRQASAMDERHYSDIVVNRWSIANETILDPPLWYDSSRPVPLLDQPRQNFMLYPREYRLCEIVRRSGGRVLLTGQGPDEYLRGTMFFFADWIARGRVCPALREMARRAAIGRVSFWDLAYRNALTPLLPSSLRSRLGPEVVRTPPWVHPGIVRRYDLHKRGYELGYLGGPPGAKYHTSIVKGVEAIQRTVGHLLLEDFLEVRHPFLDRRLVEFGLRLPPELVVQPYAGKWVLREAMRDLVPEGVRTRVGKASMDELHAWSLTTQRGLLAPLAQESVLAELGVVEATELQRAFQNAPYQAQRKGDPHAMLQQVLAIEAWLQIRAGRWPRELPEST